MDTFKLIVFSIFIICVSLNLSHIKISILDLPESESEILTGNLQQNRNSNQDSVKCPSIMDSVLHREVYLYVKEMPQYPGGMEAFYKFIYKNLTIKSEDFFQFSVTIIMIVEKDGSIKDVYVPHPYFKDRISPLEKDFMRMVKLMPKWNPGKCNGKPVPVKFTIPMRLCPSNE